MSERTEGDEMLLGGVVPVDAQGKSPVVDMVQIQRQTAEGLVMWAARALRAEELLRESQEFIGGDWRQRRDRLLNRTGEATSGEQPEAEQPSNHPAFVAGPADAPQEDTHMSHGSTVLGNAQGQSPIAATGCVWSMDDVGGDSMWETQCKNAFYFEGDGTAGPLNAGFTVCPYCAGALSESRTSDAVAER